MDNMLFSKHVFNMLDIEKLYVYTIGIIIRRVIMATIRAKAYIPSAGEVAKLKSKYPAL